MCPSPRRQRLKATPCLADPVLPFQLDPNGPYRAPPLRAPMAYKGWTFDHNALPPPAKTS